ncbi:MAG TPA: response regulator [Ktedonobacterales bacterium]|nr:response regulator [Ktedonobacterales bacterium]
MSGDGKRRIITVVEDEQQLRDMLNQVLTLEGFTLEITKNGQEVISLLEKTPTTPRVMLLDLVMPVLDGWGVVRWLVEHPDIKANTKLVLMSANERLKMASDIERDAELEKPFGIDRLLAILTPLASQ